jgi:endonuclease I
MRFPAVVAAVALASAAGSSASAQSVLLSELCDPKQNYLTDRFLEIYNAGPSAVDLTGWQLVAVGNGVDIFTWNLSGSIDPGEALVAGGTNPVVPFPIDFADAGWPASNSTWNGKVGDGAKLLAPGAVLVDIVVATGTTFENDDYVRNDDVFQPNTTYTPSEWTATAVELPTDGSPGTHTVGPPPAGPTIANAVTTPALPAAADSVTVSADVTDSVSTVASVELRWGTSAGSLPDTVAMAPAVGDAWATATPIPPQAEGTTVHFEIAATNAAAQTTVLGGLTYDVPWEITLPEIQGMVPASPYDGETAITSGVVTGVFGGLFTVQDGTGAWNGMWVQSGDAVAEGDSVTLRGRVTESALTGYTDNTVLSSAAVTASAAGAALPAAVVLPTSSLALEDYEGVLVQVQSAVCTNASLGQGEWEADDGSGPVRVGAAGYPFSPTLGTAYDVAGCATFESGVRKLHPRGAADVVWAGDAFAPVLETVGVLSDSTVLVVFSEEVDPTTAESAGNYSVPGLTVLAAARNATNPDEVTVTVTPMSPQTYTLTVDGVEDLFGNAASSVALNFDFVDTAPPAGYYDPAEGLTGDALRTALHFLIDGHTPVPYASTWTSFQTTDNKPNGKVWDIYSDVPGGTPPYEYTFGVDQGGVGGVEGTGYNREHTWPQSWFGGSVSPMESDLFQLYPTDNFVNNQRGSDPYAEVAFPAWTSLNGSRKGNSSTPGYTGPAFEPIDAYKGDVARNYFYMTTRYHLQDAGWPGSAMTSGADLLPWAVDLLLEWHAADPVDRKELERNGTIWGIQGNRNPFIDRPELAALMLSDAVGAPAGEWVPVFALGRNAPNPFGPVTRIPFAAPAGTRVRLSVYDVSGRLVATLVDGPAGAGPQEAVWDARDRDGTPASAGVYFYRFEAGERRETRRMVLLR